MTGGYGRSALLVGYADRTGLDEAYARAKGSLRDADLQVTDFFKITPDPGAPLATAGAEKARSCAADVVVALGGGSALDAAKGIAALVKSAGTVWDHTKANPNFQPITDALPVIAIPTTAGTGSEMTNIAVFSHHGVGRQPDVGLKAAIFGDCLRPRLAIVDPDLLDNCPARQVAACGVDALAHAMESCQSKNSNPLTAALAERAIELIAHNLRRAVENPGEKEPRDALALGALLAGAAINGSGVVVTHALAHGLGGVLDIPHALAVAICTPTGLRFNAEVCRETFARLARYFPLRSHKSASSQAPAWERRIDGGSAHEQAEWFVDEVVGLLRALDMPARPRVPDDAPSDLAAQLAKNALVSTPVAAGNNPRPVDEAVMRELYTAVLG
jgi:alcohol dehydrogenase class IV